MAPERRERIEAAVGAALREQGDERQLRLQRRATGGLSQETWFGVLASDAGEAEVVLRLPTRSSGAKTIAVQRHALEAVSGVVPAPAVLGFADAEGEDDAGVPGTWLIMERVAGDVPVGWHTIGDERLRGDLAAEAIDVLAAMHELDPPEELMPRSGRDGSLAEVSPAADLAVLERRLARLEPLPAALVVALRWLGESRPSPLERPVMIHGDYRMGNMIVAGGRIAAVLDWELATVGDPMADLSWCFIPIWELAGFDPGPLFERYGERRGQPVDPDRLHWYTAFNFARLAYFALSGSRAFESGASGDLRLAALGLEVPVRLDRLIKTIRREELK